MNKRIQIILAVLALAMSALACNLPGQTATQTPSEPTPNHTMTALFSIITQPPATLAPPVATATSEQHAAATSTSVPTSTQVTLPPTNTSVPLVTSTPKPTEDPRPAGKANADYLSTAPKLDGVWDEWKTTAYPARFVVYGKDKHENKEDLEGSYRIGWDSTYLYRKPQSKRDRRRYFQRRFNRIATGHRSNGDLSSTSLSSDDYQLVISPGKGSTAGDKEAYLYYPSGNAGGRPQVKISSAGGDGTYRVEAAIPWSVFGITPASGQRYGFAISVSDNDNTSANEQQSMVSNVAGRALTDPTTWAVLTLVK